MLFGWILFGMAYGSVFVVIDLWFRWDAWRRNKDWETVEQKEPSAQERACWSILVDQYWPN